MRSVVWAMILPTKQWLVESEVSGQKSVVKQEGTCPEYTDERLTALLFMDDAIDGKVDTTGHPVFTALNETIASRQLPTSLFHRLISGLPVRRQLCGPNLLGRRPSLLPQLRQPGRRACAAYRRLSHPVTR